MRPQKRKLSLSRKVQFASFMIAAMLTFMSDAFGQPPPVPCWNCPDSVNAFDYGSNQLRIYTDTNVTCSANNCGSNIRYGKITLELPPDTCCDYRICWIELFDKEKQTKFQICEAKVYGGNCDGQDWFVLNMAPGGSSFPSISQIRKPDEDSCNLSYHKALMPYYEGCPSFCDCCLMNFCTNDPHPNRIEITFAWDRSTDDPGGGHDFYLEFKLVNYDDVPCWEEVNMSNFPLALPCPLNGGSLGHPASMRLRF